MSKADYFYLTSYPTYSGYRIEHDPVTTLYLASQQPSPTVTQTPTATPTTQNGNATGLVIIIVVAAVIIAAATAIITRRKPKTEN